MKITINILLLLIAFSSKAQVSKKTGSDQYYKSTFDEKFVERPPLFLPSKDSLRNFYLSHFNAFDSLITRAITNGDTAKYIRVHFEFIVDENGVPYEPIFKYVGATTYASAKNDRKIKYYEDLKDLFKQATKQMIQQMPMWKPALQNNVRVACRREDYFQFWLGIAAPPAD